MFRVSQKTEYALRAVTELAIRHEDGLIPAREIASAQGVPLRFLEQQLSTLHKAGLVESFRGSGGGCRLARDPSEMRVADVIDVMEGNLYPMHCIDHDDHTCFQDGRCGIQGLWSDVHLAVRGVFERTSVADLAERQQQAGAGTPIFRPEELIRPAERPAIPRTAQPS